MMTGFRRTLSALAAGGMAFSFATAAQAAAEGGVYGHLTSALETKLLMRSHDGSDPRTMILRTNPEVSADP